MRGLSASLTVLALPSRSFTLSVLPSTFSIVPRRCTGFACCAWAAGKVAAIASVAAIATSPVILIVFLRFHADDLVRRLFVDLTSHRRREAASHIERLRHHRAVRLLVGGHHD